MTEDNFIFWSARQKIKRARHHIKSLELVVNIWADANKIKHDFDMQVAPDGKPLISVTTDKPVEPPPVEFSLIIGDALHNIRSSLDHMATELVIRRTGKNKKAYFPFANSKEDLPQMIKRKNFHFTGEDCVSLLSSLKPYHGGNVLLRGIHDLDIHDKHRIVDIMSSATSSPSFKFEIGDDGKPILFVGGELPIKITFPVPKEEAFEAPEILEFLQAAVELVENILDSFERLVQS